jgi:hypothetical protein
MSPPHDVIFEFIQLPGGEDAEVVIAQRQKLESLFFLILFDFLKSCVNNIEHN